MKKFLALRRAGLLILIVSVFLQIQVVCFSGYWRIFNFIKRLIEFLWGFSQNATAYEVYKTFFDFDELDILHLAITVGLVLALIGIIGVWKKQSAEGKPPAEGKTPAEKGDK